MHYTLVRSLKVQRSLCWRRLSTCRWPICHGAHAAQRCRVQPARGLQWKRRVKCDTWSELAPSHSPHLWSSVRREGPSLQHSPLRAGHRGIWHRRRRCRRHGHRWDSVFRLHLPSFRPGARIPRPPNTLLTIAWSARHYLDVLPWQYSVMTHFHCMLSSCLAMFASAVILSLLPQRIKL